MANAFDEFDAPNAFDEFDSPIVAPVAAPARKLSLAEQAAKREAQARDARVMRIIPGTGFLSPEKGRLANQQSQALLQGYTFNTADELASALAAAKTGISNLVGRGPGFSAREAYDARMRQEREQMGQFQAEHPGQATLANVGGAMLNPLTYVDIPYVAAAKGIPQVMGRAASVGGAQGAVAGAGAGDDLKSRIKGAIGGGLVSGATAGLVSGAGQKLAQGLANRAVRKAQTSVADLKTKATDLYTKADQAGLIIKSSSIKKFSDDLVNYVKSEGLRAKLHGNAIGALNELKSIKNDMSLKEADLTRRVIKDYVQSSKDKSDKRMGYLILDKFDDFVDKLSPTDTVAGSSAKPAVDLLTKAREVYAAKAKGETIENLIEKAKNNTGALGTKLEQNIKSEFKKLANNTRGISRFSEEEQKAIRNVANGSVTRNVISTLGKFAPNFNILGLGEIGAAFLGHPGPLVTSITVGTPSKLAATKATVNAARYAAALAKGAKAPVVNARPAAVAGTIAGATVAPRTRS
ncbi:hypothetical protein UFOVP1545_17 [uncultured Caudovirales phage]|uniref:Uncharacterized protein n=1 Tax=uncultured Caudovirales phage TaxID=2100421 RepID=A0A6J7XC95_9CAUD|nr:hypothetical protein UFOVP1545_17 [uncultured Caudovirales phage]